MKEPKTILIAINTESIVNDAKRELAVIGKRAKDAQGKSLFSDLTFSTQEVGELEVAITSATHELVASLSQYVGACYDDGEGTITIVDTRLPDDETELELLQSRIVPAISRYLTTYATNYFLEVIHPAYGMKYPPMYATTYGNALANRLAVVVAMITNHKPRTMSSPYTQTLTLVGSTVSVVVGEKNTVTYEIDEGVPDDIVASDFRHDDLKIAKCEYPAVNITAKKAGTYHVKLFSMHDEEVYKWLTVVATDPVNEEE